MGVCRNGNRDIILVRLRAAPATLRQRVRQRGEGVGMAWRLNRAVEQAAQMDAQPIEDVLIEVEGRDAKTIAPDILQRIGWLA